MSRSIARSYIHGRWLIRANRKNQTPLQTLLYITNASAQQQQKSQQKAFCLDQRSAKAPSIASDGRRWGRGQGIQESGRHQVERRAYGVQSPMRECSLRHGDEHLPDAGGAHGRARGCQRVQRYTVGVCRSKGSCHKARWCVWKCAVECRRAHSKRAAVDGSNLYQRLLQCVLNNGEISLNQLTLGPNTKGPASTFSTY